MVKKTNKYTYFLHGTPYGDSMEDIFKNGLRSEYGYSLHSTMWELKDLPDDIDKQKFNLELDKRIKGYQYEDKYKYVYIIKIPTVYLSKVWHSTSKNLDFPMPFWKDSIEFGRQYTRFNPHLIQGRYDPENGYITNKNYNAFYNPTGLKYSDEQISVFESYLGMSDQIGQTYDFMKKRKNKTYEELKTFDLSNYALLSKMNDYEVLLNNINSDT